MVQRMQRQRQPGLSSKPSSTIAAIRSWENPLIFCQVRIRMSLSLILTDIYKATILLPGMRFPFPIDNWDLL